jgi:hypothetical protein
MAKRPTRLEREIADLHGTDAEVIEYEEVDGEERPTGKVYRVKAKSDDPMPGAPWWARLVVAVPLAVVVVVGAIVSVIGIVLAAKMLWWGLTP